MFLLYNTVYDCILLLLYKYTHNNILDIVICIYAYSSILLLHSYCFPQIGSPGGGNASRAAPANRSASGYGVGFHFGGLWF